MQWRKMWVFKWKKTKFKGKKNSDLWSMFCKFIYDTQKIKFFWIKGHNNHLKTNDVITLLLKLKVKNLRLTMNMKKNKKNQILCYGTMAFDEIITKTLILAG